MQHPVAIQDYLRSAHVILVSTSGGKDSQTALREVVGMCNNLGIPRKRIVAVHADLGRVEWEGTKELAEEQARHYGLRFEVVAREGREVKRDSKSYQAGERYGDLLEDIRRRGKFPDNKNRFCTADQKRGPIMRLVTQLHRKFKAVSGMQFRLVNCMGMRAEESPARAKLVPWQRNERASTKTREVFDWLPIHDWTAAQVWADIRASGVRHHSAYDLGMPRLSCAFCIFANRAALTLAGKHNKRLLEQYVEVEEEIGFTFRQNLALADVLADVNTGADTGAIDDWEM